MTAKKQSNRHPMGEISFDPLNEPRTIPTGWQVAAFYQPEQDSQDSTCAGEQFNHPDPDTRTQNGSTQDPV
jgi:hypothetical protein